MKASLLCAQLNLWKAVKIAHMVFISPSEKHHNLPGSAIHIKLNHIHRLWPMTDSFTSFRGPYRETTAPINLTSKNVQKYPPPTHPHPPEHHHHHHHHCQHTPTHSPPPSSKVHTHKIAQKPTRFRISNQSNPIKLTKLGKFFE